MGHHVMPAALKMRFDATGWDVLHLGPLFVLVQERLVLVHDAFDRFPSQILVGSFTMVMKTNLKQYGLEAAERLRLEVSKWGQPLGVVAVVAETEQEVERVVEHPPGRAGWQASPWLPFRLRAWFCSYAYR
jgi:hypothetical protein